MVTVTTFEELAAAVRRDEVCIHLEGEAKYYYEKNVSNAIGGGLIGALPGLCLLGPLGAVAGAVIGATVASQSGDADIQRFLLTYYRRSSSGVTYIELTHR
ncbi:MAG: hypothetical protein IK130_01875 [Oscillospiraceae bacterium]|nr:hypothetical protein [Oscillospiraceae bacterium]